MDMKKIYDNRIMPKFLTEEDKESLLKKTFNPFEEVHCPRCHAELQHIAYANGSETFCPTVGCLYSSMRGL